MRRFLVLVALTLIFATLLGFCGELWWPFELLDHLRAYYILTALGILLIGLWARQTIALLLVLPLFINVVLLWPLFAPSAPTASATTFSLTHLALDKDKLDGLHYASEAGSDLVLLQELTPPLADQLSLLLPTYQLVLAQPLWNTHGSAILLHEEAGIEVISAEAIHLPATAERPLLTAKLRIDNQDVQLLSLHTTRARNQATSFGQAAELAAVALWRQQQSDSHVLIIGDFNSTPWSARVRRLMQQSRLKNGMHGRGWQPSWPTPLPKLFQLPIDLLLHSDQLQVTSLSTGPTFGSDHRPIDVGMTFIPLP